MPSQPSDALAIAQSLRGLSPTIVVVLPPPHPTLVEAGSSDKKNDGFSPAAIATRVFSAPSSLQFRPHEVKYDPPPWLRADVALTRPVRGVAADLPCGGRLVVFWHNILDVAIGSHTLGGFDAAWDRGGVNRLPVASRAEYVSKLNSLLRPPGRILFFARAAAESSFFASLRVLFAPSTWTNGAHVTRVAAGYASSAHRKGARGRTISECSFMVYREANPEGMNELRAPTCNCCW